MAGPTLSPTGNTNKPPKGAQLVTLAVPLFVLKAQYTTPDGHQKPLPKHRWTALATKAGAQTAAQRGTASDNQGVSSIDSGNVFADDTLSWHLFWEPEYADFNDQLDFATSHEAWIDLDKNEWVPSHNVAALEKRRLVRIGLWSTPIKAKNGQFNDSPNADFTNTGLLKGTDILARIKAKNPFGTRAKPWLFNIDHQWFRTFLRYRFYNFKTKDEDFVPPGLVVRAKLADGTNVGGGTAFDTKGTVFILHQQVKNDVKTKVDYQFDTPLSFSIVDLDVAAPASPPPAVDNRVSKVDALPDGGPKRRYVLPTTWHSLGMEAFLETGGAAHGARQAFTALRGEDTTIDKPLGFHLDDVVLFDSAANAPSVLPAASRVTVFDRRLKFKGPFDPVFVHMLLQQLAGSFLRAEELFVKKGDEFPDSTFVINHEADFFVVRDARIAGTPGTTQQLGARKAAARDPANPIGNFLAGYPSMANNGTVQLHLLPDAYDGPYDDTKEGKFLKDNGTTKLTHLLVYVPLRVQPAVQGPNFVDAPNAVDLVPAASMNVVYQALVDAAVRWDQAHPANGATGKKDYVLVPDSGAPANTRIVKFRHFFGARTDGNHKFTILGAYRNQMNSIGDRSFVQGKTMSLVVTPRPPAAPSWTGTASSSDSDTLSFTDFVLAHELGHVMGLPDEYGELIAIPAPPPAVPPAVAPPPVFTTNEPRILRFGQRDAGYPFYADLDGMMRGLKLARLRYIWHHIAAFINGGAGAQLPAQPYSAQAPAFHAGTTHRIPEGNNASPWTVAVQQPGPGSRSTLVLYRCGDDEATVERMFPRPAGTASTPGSWMQGILVVTPRIWFNFLASGGGNFPNDAARWAVMENFHRMLFTPSMVAIQRFFIDGAAALRLPRIGILFQPRFEFGPAPNPLAGFTPPNATEANADCVVDVVFQAAGPPKPAVNPPHWPPSTKPRLTIDIGNAGLAILRFALNIAPGSPPNNGAITAAELAPLATQVQTMLGDAAGSAARTVKALPP